MTFLAVTWDSLPVAVQTTVMAALAAVALAGAVPTARHKLAGTAEALAILGTGLLLTDLYAARELGLVAPAWIDTLTHTALLAVIVAAINLLMHRVAPTVKTFGVVAVVIGQLPLPFYLADRVTLAELLLGLTAQAVITVLWAARSTASIRVTGAICTTTVLTGVLLTGAGRALLALAAHHDPILFADLTTNDFTAALTAFPFLAATTTVSCIAAGTGITLLHHRVLLRSLPPALGDSVCVSIAAFTVAVFLPQVPEAGRWLTTALATALALTTLLRARRTGVPTMMLQLATIVTGAVAVLVAALFADVIQLSLIAALAAGLALLACWRKELDVTTAATIASLSAQASIALAVLDTFVTVRAGGIALAVVAACGIAAATRYVGRPPERALLLSATAAAVFAEFLILTVSPETGTGVVLAIVAAPLIAYGLQPDRREALVLAGLLLTVANTGFALGAGTSTVEWFTVPPAIAMLALGVLGRRDHPSWLFLGPGLLLGLLPSTLLANSNDTLRTTLVVTAAVVVILLGVRLALQAPFVVGAAALAKIGLWQFLEVAPLVPRWITLGLAGLILLTVGATYERRLQQARQAAHWLTSLR